MTSKRYHSGVFITKSEQTNAAWVPSYNLVDIYLLWLYICMGKKTYFRVQNKQSLKYFSRLVNGMVSLSLVD